MAGETTATDNGTLTLPGFEIPPGEAPESTSSSSAESCILSDDANLNMADRKSSGECELGSWLGLMMSHRRLFDALQDGWLRPGESRNGHLLGDGAFVREPDDGPQGRHPILVRTKLDPAKLPDLGVLVHCDDRWGEVRFETRPPGRPVYWPGPLPTFAISELAVETEEVRARLAGLARNFSNVVLPVEPVVSVSADSLDPPSPPIEAPRGLDIPDAVDARQGAMCMALWAVPRMAPWLDLLVASLSRGGDLSTSAKKVESDWWVFPPWWASPTTAPSPCDSQAQLWRAAVEVFAGCARDAPPHELAGKIASVVHNSAEVTDWHESTIRILRAESTIRPDQGESRPVGIAIQMVLARPEPTRFKTWARDMPGLPPAVWWSAAVLCGLRTGYRRLDRQFRGSPVQQESLAIHALGTCGGDKAVHWPSVSGAPRWSRREDRFALLWGDREVDWKRAQSRGKWLDADFEAPDTAAAALRLANRLKWRCVRKRITFRKDCRLPYAGEVRPDGDELAIRGGTFIDLPDDVPVEDSLDVKEFRRLLIVAPGQVPEPPLATMGAAMAEAALGPEPVTEQPSNVLGIPGLVYVPNFVSEEEESKLIEEIDQAPWSDELSRRVQHYGWKYDYKARQVDPSMHIGPLPEWAESLGDRLVERKFLSEKPDQVIVNEYCGRQGIARHADAQSFADGIATISLHETWEMNFHWKKGKREKRKLRLERRSALVMHGEARYDWEHEIPNRKTESNPPGVKPRTTQRRRRLSLTFRKVLRQDVSDRPTDELGRRR